MLSGEIPMSVAAGSFNVSLAHLLLYVPDQNTSKSDGRGRVILPTIAGAHKPLKIAGELDDRIGRDLGHGSYISRPIGEIR